METAITGLIVIGVMILAITGISNSALSAQATVSEATRIAQERVGERVRTQIAPTNVTTDINGESVTLTVKNVGITRLADFYRWDVIVEVL